MLKSTARASTATSNSPIYYQYNPVADRPHSRAGTVARRLRRSVRPACAITSRSFATEAPPVRRYGGLKDQDRIFTNAYCRHDHGIKGAKVRLQTSS